MACIYRFQGLTRDIGELAYPGQAGYGDIGCATDARMDPSKTFEYLDYNTISITTPSTRSLVALRAVDSAVSGEPYWVIRPDQQLGISTVTGAWSMRMYYKKTSHNTTNYPIFRFYEGATSNIYCYFTTSSTTSSRITTPSAQGNPTLPSSTGIYRIELQADPDRDPAVVCRVYSEDSTTAISSWSHNYNTTWDTLRIGHFISGNFSASTILYGDIELHDNYDLGGQFTSNPATPTAASTSATGAPSTNPVIDSRFNYDSGSGKTLQETELEEDVDFTKYSDINYVDSASHYARRVDIYIPSGSSPSGGWPLVMWAHSGFFIDGSKNALPTNWRDDLLNNGYAVASVQYVKSSIDAVDPYDDYGGGGNNGGRYPSHIIDYKRAGAFLRDNSSTYNLNPNKIIASGFSAGGYIALGAFLSRGLSVDTDGNPLTLAGASLAGHPWADNYSGIDPDFAGCLVYAAPVDIDAAVAWDPTNPNVGRIISASSRAFQGLLQNGNTAPSKPTAALQTYIALNESNITRPIAYVRGTGDYLVHWEHEQLLSEAIDTMSNYSKYTLYTTPNQHDHANDIYDREETISWLNSVPALNEAEAMAWTPSTVLY